MRSYTSASAASRRAAQTAAAAVASLSPSPWTSPSPLRTPLHTRGSRSVLLMTTLVLTPGAFLAPGAVMAAPAPAVRTAAQELPAAAVTASPATSAARAPAPSAASAASAGVVQASAAAVPLSGLTPVSAVNGYGPMSRNRSNGGPAAGDGGPLTVNGHRYSQGLGVAAQSGLTYRLSGQYATFSTAIGVDDEVGSHGKVTFEVWADGTRRFASTAYTGSGAARQVTINVTGVRTLGLTVRGTQGARYDHADWAGATLTRRAAPLHRSLVHFGDSVASGYACGCTPYPGVHAGLAARRTGDVVAADNLARSGYTSSDVRRQVESATSVADIRRADAVAIMIGANDFGTSFGQVWHGASPGSTYAPVAARVKANLTSMITRVRALHHTPVRVVVLGYWNVMKDGKVARAAYGPAGVKASNEATTYANNAILGAARATGATYVSTLPVFKGADGRTDPTSLLAADGDHPNARGHQLIAQALLGALPQG